MKLGGTTEFKYGFVLSETVGRGRFVVLPAPGRPRGGGAELGGGPEVLPRRTWFVL